MFRSTRFKFYLVVWSVGVLYWLPSSLAAKGERLPEPIVCQDMERLGASLLDGDARDFYFVRALGGYLPVPRFAVVHGGDLDYPGLTSLRMRADNAGGRLSDMGNACAWHMNMSFGPLEGLEYYIGPESEYRKNLREQYALGELTILVLENPGLGNMLTVVAYNSQGYVGFASPSEDPPLWMIDLFHQFN